MKLIDFLGSIGAALLIAFFLGRAFKSLHRPSEKRKEDLNALNNTIEEMREGLEKLKKDL